MTEDELMKRLGAVGREEQQVDSLEALSADTLTASQQVELEAQADSPAVQQAIEAHRPLGDDVKARLLERARAELGCPASNQTSDKASDQASKQAHGRRQRVLPRRRHRWRVGLVAAAVAAAAAAAFLVLGPTSELTPLPSYTLTLQGGLQQTRSDPAPPEPHRALRLAPGAPLSLLLRPRRAVDGPVVARVFVEQRGRVSTLAVRAERAPQGAVRVRGTVGRDLVLPAGPSTLWIALAREGQLPGRVDLQRWLDQGRSAKARPGLLLSTRLHVEERRQ